jgi:predicted permease
VSVLGDLRYAVRLLRRTPGFTAVAVLTLGLGIGANTALFSVVSALLLRPLPYPEAGELLMIRHRARLASPGWFSHGAVADLRAQSRAVRGLTAYKPVRMVVSGAPEAEVLDGIAASADFFSVLGISPALGRGFVAGEDEPGQSRVVVLSDELWRRRYGADPGVVGRTLLIDGQSFTAIGVAPAHLRFPMGATPALRGTPGFAQLWVPLNDRMDADARQWRGMRYLGVIGRLAAGTSLAAARTELDLIAARLAREHAKDDGGFTIEATTLQEDWLYGGRTPLILLLGAVTFVLLIACANVAGLQLIRGKARRRELAIRIALGAGPGRLMRQLLTESLLLALAGGGLGVLMAKLALSALVALVPREVPRFHPITLDGRVLGYTLAVALATGLVMGLAPAVAAARTRVSEVTARATRGRMGAAVVIAQIALAFVLLIGAGLLARSFSRVVGGDPGFDARALLTARINLPAPRYANGGQRRLLHRSLEERLTALPGVRAAAVALRLPYAGAGSFKAAPPGAEPFFVETLNVGPSYFRTLGIALRRGRTFQGADEASDAPLVGIVNETLARRYWTDGKDVGGVMRFGHWPGQIPIVGVVADTRRLDRPAEPELYLPLGEGSSLRQLFVAIRADTPVATSLRAAVNAVDPALAITDVRTMENAIGESLAQRRLNLSLLALFAALALVLTVIGTYGVISYGVAQRQQEMAIRLALGASSGRVLRMVVSDALTMAGLGVALGLAAALALTRLLASQLYGVSATDPTTFVGVSAIALVAALAAAYLPGRRAAAVDPMVTLRHE